MSDLNRQDPEKRIAELEEALFGALECLVNASMLFDLLHPSPGRELLDWKLKYQGLPAAWQNTLGIEAVRRVVRKRKGLDGSDERRSNGAARHDS